MINKVYIKTLWAQMKATAEEKEPEIPGSHQEADDLLIYMIEALMPDDEDVADLIEQFLENYDLVEKYYERKDNNGAG